MILLCGFQVLLHLYTNQRDIRVGVPHANRNRAEAERVIGLFANTHVLSTSVEEHLSARRAHHACQRDSACSPSTSGHALRASRRGASAERSLSHNPLFQVMMNHQRRDFRTLHRLPDLSFEPYELGELGAQVELTLNTFESPSGDLAGMFLYAAEIFEGNDHSATGRTLYKSAAGSRGRVG